MAGSQRYISKELTHFVGRERPENEQWSLLVKILKSGWLTHRPHDQETSYSLIVNPGAKISQNEMYSPLTVCFCDIPVDDLEIHMSKYSRFGLAFLKSFLVKAGANPVFYVARNSIVRTWPDLSDRAKIVERACAGDPFEIFEQIPRGVHFDNMLQKYHQFYFDLRDASNPSGAESAEESTDFRRFHDLRWFFEFHIFSFLKVFDDAKIDDDPENYYMEREWRIIDNLRFELKDVRRVILPESYAKRLREEVPDYFGQVTFAE